MSNGKSKEGCCCGTSEATPESKKTVVIDYLFLDLKTCDRCIANRDVLEKVLYDLIPVFDRAGYRVKYNKTEISSREKAEEFRLLTSPTIRVNGHDICETVEENDCECCRDLAGGIPVDCRVFVYEGRKYEIVPQTMLYEGILRYSMRECAKPTSDYLMPENLSKFFDNKSLKYGNEETNKTKKCCC